MNFLRTLLEYADQYSQLLLVLITAFYVVLTYYIVRELRRQSKVHIYLQDIIRLKETIRLCFERVLLHVSPFEQYQFDAVAGRWEQSPGLALEMQRESHPVLTPELKEHLGDYLKALRTYGERTESLHTSEQFTTPIPNEAFLTTQARLIMTFHNDNKELIGRIREQTFELTKKLEQMI